MHDIKENKSQSQSLSVNRDVTDARVTEIKVVYINDTSDACFVYH